jgi:predicted transcriptional regulator
MTIRLSAEQADALETVASVEQRAVSDVIRAAIAEHIEGRCRDPDFRRGLQARIDRASQLLGNTSRPTED